MIKHIKLPTTEIWIDERSIRIEADEIEIPANKKGPEEDQEKINEMLRSEICALTHKIRDLEAELPSKADVSSLRVDPTVVDDINRALKDSAVCSGFTDLRAAMGSATSVDIPSLQACACNSGDSATKRRDQLAEDIRFLKRRRMIV